MLALLSALSCTPDPADSGEPADSAPMEFAFSFVVLADPHITGNADHTERLETAVQWINDHTAERSIEMVVVVGDIGWGAGLEPSAEMLAQLQAPWLPILGDNEISTGDEARFDEVFGPQYDVLAGQVSDYRRGQVEVEGVNGTMTMQNHVFTHQGLRWVGLDWNSRHDGGLLSEFAEIHDTPGGTLPFFADVLSDLEATDSEDVLLFSHHPMHLGSFDEEEMAAITAITGPISGRVAGAYAGHMHVSGEVEVSEGGYIAWITDATWDDENTLRVVSVYSSGSRWRYEQELVEL
ncbi:MAG: metallophosphoesterase [Myxococcota bacterium]|nr:metallophosphoesterase [Myxococcota bacterium]